MTMGDAKLKVADALLAAGLEQAFRMGADKGAKEVVRLEKQRDELLAVLMKVNANCDHTDDCDRAREWATDATACMCCMRDVEAALSKAKEGR
jgi:hypothetical protein